MSNTPKQKKPSNKQVIDALIQQNGQLITKVEALEAELEKERSGQIKLPMAPSVGQVNKIIDWVQKIKNYYASVGEVPEKMKEETPANTGGSEYSTEAHRNWSEEQTKNTFYNDKPTAPVG
jgi:dissimilatory sulfite reductase (desulfoviridin) alpha/beta subunit